MNNHNTLNNNNNNNYTLAAKDPKQLVLLMHGMCSWVFMGSLIGDTECLSHTPPHEAMNTHEPLKLSTHEPMKYGFLKNSKKT